MMPLTAYAGYLMHSTLYCWFYRLNAVRTEDDWVCRPDDIRTKNKWVCTRAVRKSQLRCILPGVRKHGAIAVASRILRNLRGKPGLFSL